jgi:hypothetical protein
LRHALRAVACLDNQDGYSPERKLAGCAAIAELVIRQVFIDEVYVPDSQRVADRLSTTGKCHVSQAKGSECVHTGILNGKG